MYAAATEKQVDRREDASATTAGAAGADHPAFEFCGEQVKDRQAAGTAGSTPTMAR